MPGKALRRQSATSIFQYDLAPSTSMPLAAGRRDMGKAWRRLRGTAFALPLARPESRIRMPHCPACNTNVAPETTRCENCGAPFDQPARGLLESRLTPSQEAAIRVPRAIPLALGVAAIGGAAAGILATIVAGIARPPRGAGAELVYVLGAALYIFAGYCGVAALQRRPGWVRKNLVLWAMQVPVFISPLVTYTFTNGALLSVWLRVDSAGAGANFLFGSNLAMTLFTPGPLVLGVNILAVALALYLRKLERAAGDS